MSVPSRDLLNRRGLVGIDRASTTAAKSGDSGTFRVDKLHFCDGAMKKAQEAGMDSSSDSHRALQHQVGRKPALTATL